MKETVIKLAKSGWNISNTKNGPIAWLYKDQVTKEHHIDIKHILCEPDLLECSYTDTVSVVLNFPIHGIKEHLLKNKLLPSNYNELQMTARYIKL